jgi:hypothetical protein
VTLTLGVAFECLSPRVRGYDGEATPEVLASMRWTGCPYTPPPVARKWCAVGDGVLGGVARCYTRILSATRGTNRPCAPPLFGLECFAVVGQGKRERDRRDWNVPVLSTGLTGSLVEADTHHNQSIDGYHILHTCAKIYLLNIPWLNIQGHGDPNGAVLAGVGYTGIIGWKEADG